jgi:hypothetical protein
VAQTPSERRAAQRRTARQIETGTYKPSGAGAKARRAATLLGQRDAAFLNIKRRIGHYHKYNEDTVRANVYSGTTAEWGPVPGMDLEQARFFAAADEDALIAFATPQYPKNPGYYH